MIPNCLGLLKEHPQSLTMSNLVEGVTNVVKTRPINEPESSVHGSLVELVIEEPVTS